jgi:hypothetical protein
MAAQYKDKKGAQCCNTISSPHASQEQILTQYHHHPGTAYYQYFVHYNATNMHDFLRVVSTSRMRNKMPGSRTCAPFCMSL